MSVLGGYRLRRLLADSSSTTPTDFIAGYPCANCLPGVARVDYRIARRNRRGYATDIVFSRARAFQTGFMETTLQNNERTTNGQEKRAMAAKKWVIGNWKLQGSLLFNQGLIENIRARLPVLDDRVGMAVSPVFPYLAQVADLLEGSAIVLGAQNLSEHTTGAYTGEVAGPMLKELGVQLAIVGHSERRAYQGEDDELIGKKIRAALDAGLMPVLCIGETKQERDADETKVVLARQLDAVFQILDTTQDEIVIAYEPRWAIGTGVSATPDMIADVHGFLRAYLVARDAGFGARTPILYGGSMNGANAASIAAIKDVDGGLIGSAALKADEFVAIYNAVLAAV